MTTLNSSVVATAPVVASFAMFNGKRDRQLLASLFVSSYSHEALFGELDMIGFDYKSHMAALEIEVLTNGIKLTKQTVSKHPLARQPEERISTWLERVGADDSCSGVVVVVPAHLLTAQQVSALYTACVPPKYGEETSNSLVAQFCCAAEPVVAAEPAQVEAVVSPEAVAAAVTRFYGMKKAEVAKAYEAAIGSSRGWTKAEMVGRLVAATLAG